MTDQEKRKRFWKILITIVVLWFVVLPIILAAALALKHYHQQTGRPATRIVPNLIGLDSQSAQDKARDAGFLMTVMGRDWNLPDSPCTLGRITKQEPRGGEAVQFEQIGVVTCVEDPDEKFWKEQRKRSSAQPKS
jgi:beta-lactam-binding protein with PASTA domain